MHMYPATSELRKSNHGIQSMILSTIYEIEYWLSADAKKTSISRQNSGRISVDCFPKGTSSTDLSCLILTNSFRETKTI